MCLLSALSLKGVYSPSSHALAFLSFPWYHPRVLHLKRADVQRQWRVSDSAIARIKPITTPEEQSKRLRFRYHSPYILL